MRRLSRLVLCAVSLFVAVAAMLAPGCGGGGDEGGGEVNTISYGWIVDLTGRAGVEVKKMYDGTRDYLHYASETGLVPEGIALKLDTYDTQGDSAKVPPGYVYMKGRGVDVVHVFGYQIPLVLDQMKTDHIPCITSSLQQSTTNLDEVVGIYGAVEHGQELALTYIMNTWDYSRGIPKVGMVLYSGVGTYESRRDFVSAFCAQHADKLNWIGAQEAPIGTTVWASQADALKGADFVIPSISGTPTINFVNQIRASGFTGAFISDQDFMGAWGMLVGAVEPAALDGTVVASWVPWWSDADNPWMATVIEYCQKYNTATEYASYRQFSSYQTGWAVGELVTEVVRIAAEDVGAANVDSVAIQDAMFKIHKDVVGFGHTWEVGTDSHFVIRSGIAYRYSVAAGDFVAATDWMVPPSLAGN